MLKKQTVKAQKPPVKKTDKAAQPAPAAAEPLFPIDVIGGSAGGIEAVSKFLAHLQPDLGIA